MMCFLINLSFMNQNTTSAAIYSWRPMQRSDSSERDSNESLHSLQNNSIEDASQL